MQLKYFLLVFLGGGAGSVARYAVTTLVGARLGAAFPWGTLAVNAVGSLLMGLLMGFALGVRTSLPEPVRLLLAVGFLGGFTTFSSFSMETVTLITGGSHLEALANVLANCLIGFALAALGVALTRSL